MQECRMDYLKRIMEINVWSNKWIMDELFSGGRLVEQLIAISSGALFLEVEVGMATVCQRQL